MALSPSEQRRFLTESLADQPELAGTLEFVWRQARVSFPPQRVAEWMRACRDISSRLGSNAALSYIRNSPTVAAAAGPDAALALAAGAFEIAAAAGANAAVSLVVAAPLVGRRLASHQAFTEWLRVVGLVAELAPESITLLLDRSASVLKNVDLRGFEAWALGGIRAAENDPERRLKFFALLDPKATQILAREASELQYADVERELKAYVVALWRISPPIRTLAPAGFDAASRTSFGNGIIRVPVCFKGYTGHDARALYRASLAHVLAHFQFTAKKFPLGGLKPVQVALISLIEDARVERLALRTYPGLRRLFLPFHRAQASGAITAPALMARLARALIDPGYVDDNAFVQNGQRLFFGQANDWEDPNLSRVLGGLLGNDLGQMRVQFNAKSYVVEPAYRDDNQGLWELATSSAPQDGGTVFEAARLQPAEAQKPDRERETPEPDRERESANRVALVQAHEEVGIPVARYPEWDFLIGRDRSEWTTILEYQPAEAGEGHIEHILESYPELVYRVTSLVGAAKVSRPRRLRRQPEGDRLDLEACIDAAIDRRNGGTPNPKVYARLERRFRDLSVLLLLDASESTNDMVRGLGKSVLDLERDATALLAHAMDGLGDPFAIHAFCSDTRENVHYYRIKDFDRSYDASAKRRLAGLTGRFSTRMGAALRHAGRDLARQMSYRRLLLMISDGEPSDVDIADRRYLVEDARRAVMSIQHLGVDVFCVGLDAGGEQYLRRIFGPRNVVQVDRLERLPEKLPLLYFRLTG
jgi:nitric oxide reductase NorD protein